MKEIKLTQDKVTQVDDEDYDYLNQWKWCAHKCGNTYYAVRTRWIKNKSFTIHLHRLLMNIPKGKMLDHRDHDGLNNQKYNLRTCTHSQNAMNGRAHGYCKYRGVFYSRNNIRAKITINGKSIYLGNSFKTEEEAAMAFDNAAKIYFGEFANLNFK